MTAPSAAPQRPVCASCGSPDVIADAYARWDDAAQEWVLTVAFEGSACCEVCATPRIVWQAIERAA